MFDLNDFDETLPGPFEYDVKRMAASFTIAARNNGFSEGRCARPRVASVSGLPGGDGRVRRDAHDGHLVRPPVRGGRCMVGDRARRRAEKGKRRRR